MSDGYLATREEIDAVFNSATKRNLCMGGVGLTIPLVTSSAIFLWAGVVPTTSYILLAVGLALAFTCGMFALRYHLRLRRTLKAIKSRPCE